jgi:hypothetical protein
MAAAFTIVKKKKGSKKQHDPQEKDAYYRQLAMNKKPAYIQDITNTCAAILIGKNGHQIMAFVKQFEDNYGIKNAVWISNYKINGESLEGYRQLCLRGGTLETAQQMLADIIEYVAIYCITGIIQGSLRSYQEEFDILYKPEPVVRTTIPMKKERMEIVRPIIQVSSPPSTEDNSLFSFDLLNHPTSNKSDIDSFFHSIHLEQYIQCFRLAEIDVTLLKLMKKEHFDELKIPLGHRIRIQSALNNK